MHKIAYLTEAEHDLEYIYYHYAVERNVVGVADKIIHSIKSSIVNSLAFEPAMGRPIESNVADLRGFLVNRSHWVLYNFDEDTIYVRRIRAAKELISWDNIDL